MSGGPSEQFPVRGERGRYADGGAAGTRCGNPQHDGRAAVGRALDPERALQLEARSCMPSRPQWPPYPRNSGSTWKPRPSSRTDRLSPRGA